MNIDNTPAIRAFVEERIETYNRSRNDNSGKEVIRELNLIVTLCEGLTKQNELLTKALGI
jgi:hypothetical protein